MKGPLLVLLFTLVELLVRSRSTSTISEDIVQPTIYEPTDLFTGFFPCVPDTNSIHTQEDAQSCDLFVYAAVQLALERVNEELEDCTKLRLSPINLPSDTKNAEFLFNLYKTVSNLGKQFSKGLALMRAAIGTDNNYNIGKQAVAISQNIGIPIVSYGLSDKRVDVYRNFYRTIPSILALNQARVKLLDYFTWYRIGILGSQQSDYSYEMEQFREFFNFYVERQIQADLSYEGLTSNLSSSLRDLHRFDIRIIMGFFGPEESRLVLCEASKYNLTTLDHVWILPSYYNPDWWKGGGDSYHSDQQTRTCTDEDMMDILNSVIFIDPVKYPPMGTTLSEFYPALLNKTRDLFSELDPEVPLERLLQHSRAVSAYDSTLLLAHSLSDGEINIRKLESQIVCELCRLYPKVVSTEDEFIFCQNLSLMCQYAADSLELDETVGIINGYGQVLISQFINGTHCPMVLFWPINSTRPEALRLNFVFINSLANQTFARELGLDPQIMFPDTAACPKNFTWKGSSAPISNVLLFNEVPKWALALVGLITVLSEVLIICLIVFSIFWRENHRVKATSPRVNILILIGAALVLLYPLFQGILLSGIRYQLEDPFASTLCQLNLWLPTIGDSLFFSGLVMKAFRLYRIYQNKSLRVKLYMLNDRYLILGAFVLIVPVLLILIIWNSISPFLFEKKYIENGNIQYIQVTTCLSKNPTFVDVLYATIRLYLGILFIAAIGLTLFVPAKAPESIKLDVAVTRVALAIRSIPRIAALCAEVVVAGSPLLLGPTVWWFHVGDWLVGTTLVVCALFVYQAVLVARDHIIKEYGDISVVRKRRSETQKSETQYHRSLLEQMTELSDSLYEKEAAIRHLKAQKQVLNDTQRTGYRSNVVT